MSVKVQRRFIWPPVRLRRKLQPYAYYWLDGKPHILVPYQEWKNDRRIR